MTRVTLNLPEKFLYETTLSVRVSDLNYGGHVGYDRILTLLQEVRVLFYRELGFENEVSFEGTIGQVISDATVVYKGEAFLADELLIKLAPVDFHKYGFSFIHVITRLSDGKEIARAKTGIICFDYSIRKVALIPAILNQKLQTYGKSDA